MKKTIVIVIILIYIASIAVVNFFGLEVQVFDGITYVERIQCNSITVHNENSVTLSSSQELSGKPLFIFDFVPASDEEPYSTDDQSIVNNPNVIQINYEVLPHDADETDVVFEYDVEAMEGIVYYHELSRTFVFLKPNKIITITIKATDGSNKSTQIAIMGRVPKNKTISEE